MKKIAPSTFQPKGASSAGFVLKRDGRTAESHEEHHRIQMLEESKRRPRQRIFEVEDKIIEKRDQMISDLEARI